MLTKPDLERIEGLVRWFDRHLRSPSRLSLSRRPHAKNQAIGWFKIGAQNHIAKMRELQAILESLGYGTEVIPTYRPGYVVDEDQFQIAAYPFRDTPT